MPGSVIRSFWPQWFTAGARGTRDRRKGHPGPLAIIRVRRYGDPDGESWGRLPLFAATMISDAEIPINRRMRRWEAKRRPLNSKAERLAIETKRLLRKECLLNQSREGRHETRGPGRELSPAAYALSLGGIGVAEYAINYASFSSWFSASDSWLTFLSFGWQLYLAAALPSVLIPFFGHTLGRALKHARATRIRHTDVIVALAAAGSSAWLLLAMANLRDLDLAAHTATTGSGAYWGLFALNFAALVGGMILSYLRHGEDADHEDSDRQAARVERKSQRKRKAWEPVAARHDWHRAAVIHDVEATQRAAVTRCLEYADYNSMGAEGASSILPDGIDLHYFQPRDFSTELSRTPPTLTEMHETGGGLEHGADATELQPKLNGSAPPVATRWPTVPPTAADGDDDARH